MTVREIGKTADETFGEKMCFYSKRSKAIYLFYCHLTKLIT